MAKKIVAITGSYRRGRVIDIAVEQILEGARKAGAETIVINLLDKYIEFCTNCRSCAGDDPKAARGKCIHNDDMEAILRQVDEADGVVLAAPMNFYNVTAIMRRFIERLVMYSYWPWGTKGAPAFRIKTATKKAVIVTSSACPMIMGRILLPGALNALKTAAKCMGAKTLKSLYFGMCAVEKQQPLTQRKLKKAYQAGARLASA